jgi:hypothetical protein
MLTFSIPPRILSKSQKPKVDDMKKMQTQGSGGVWLKLALIVLFLLGFAACRNQDAGTASSQVPAVAKPVIRDLLKETWRPSGEMVKITREGGHLLVDVACTGEKERFPNIGMFGPKPEDWRGYHTLSMRVKLTSDLPDILDNGKDVCFEIFSRPKAVQVHQQVCLGSWIDLRIPLTMISRSAISGLKFHMYEGTLKIPHTYRFEIARMELEGLAAGAPWFDGTPLWTPLKGQADKPGQTLAAQGGISLQLGKHGGIASLKSAGHELATPFSPGGLLIRDASRGQPPQPVGGSLKPGKDGQILQTSRQDDLAISAAFQEKDGVITVSGKVANLRPETRLVTVYFAVPLKEGAWQWWEDLSHSIEPIRDYAGCPIPEVQQDKLPIGAMTLPGEAGIALGLRMDQPRNYRIGFNAAQRLLYIAYDFALMDLKTAQGKSLNEADFCMVLYGFDPAWGFRSAWKCYGEAFPEFFARRGGMSGGGWTAAGYVAKLTDEQIRTYGGRFTWGATERTPQQAAAHRAHGILDFVYLEPQYVQLSLADHPLPSARIARERLRKLAVRDAAEWEKYSRLTYAKTYAKDPYARQYGLKELECGKAASLLASAARTLDDEMILGIEGSREWIGNNQIGLMTRCNLSPGIPGGRGEFALEYYRCAEAAFRREMGFEVGGFALDCFMWGGSSDFCRRHFHYAPCPLTFDPVSRQPCLPNVLTDSLWLQALAGYAHPQGKILFANLGQKYTFSAPFLDVFGKEGGSAEDPEYLRMMAGPRTATYLPYFKQKPESVYAHLLYGIYPGGTAQDIGIYERMIPVLDQLQAASWEPVTGAQTETAGIQIERYGRNYLVLHNPGGVQTAKIRLDGHVLNPKFHKANVIFAGFGKTGTEIPVRDGWLELDIDAKDTVALQLAE